LVIYFTYGLSHSTLRRRVAAGVEQTT